MSTDTMPARPATSVVFEDDTRATLASTPKNNDEQFFNSSSPSYNEPRIVPPLTDYELDDFEIKFENNPDMMATSLPYRMLAFDLIQMDDRFITDPQYKKRKLAIYSRDIAVRSHVVPKRGSVPMSIVENEEVLLPQFDIAVMPMWKVQEEDQMPLDVYTRSMARSRDSLRRLMDIEVFKVLNAACTADHVIGTSGSLQPENLALAISMLEEHELEPANIVMAPQAFKEFLIWQFCGDLDPHIFQIVPRRLRRKQAIWGYFDEIPIRVSTMCPKNSVYITAEKHLVGRIPIFSTLNESQCYDGAKKRRGFTLGQEIGIGVMNDYTVVRIGIGTSFYTEKFTQDQSKLIKNLIHEELQKKEKLVKEELQKEVEEFSDSCR